MSGPHLGHGPSADHDGDTRREVNAALVDVMPWMVSLLFHLGIVILAFFLVWATIRGVDQEEITTPISGLDPAPSLNQPTLRQHSLSESAMSRRTLTQNLVRPVSAATTQMRAPSFELGIAGGELATASPFGTGPSVGDRPGTGLFDIGGRANTVVFLIDAGGMMIDTMPFVLAELKRSIDGLSEKQRFNVVFFGGGKPFEVPVPSRGMKVADEAAKQAVKQWIDLEAGNVRPQGQPNSIDAIEMALRYKPESVVLLSADFTRRGKYAIHPDDLIAAVQRANTRPSRINTIQFVYPDPLQALGRKPTLQRISEMTGGAYRFVDARELQGR